MSSDWNDEFTKLVNRGLGDSGAETAETIQVAKPDSEGTAAARRASIAATLVELGFIPGDRATPNNPAVEVLAELLPPEAKVELCLTCHEFSCSGAYEFAHSTGQFPDVATRYAPGVHGSGGMLVKGPRRDLVLCTQAAVCWTYSQARASREDTVTLYSVPFTDILGASVRHGHKGVVEVYIDEGPTMCFHVERDVVEALQAQVDQAAQSA